MIKPLQAEMKKPGRERPGAPFHEGITLQPRALGQREYPHGRQTPAHYFADVHLPYKYGNLAVGNDVVFTRPVVGELRLEIQIQREESGCMDLTTFDDLVDRTFKVPHQA